MRVEEETRETRGLVFQHPAEYANLLLEQEELVNKRAYSKRSLDVMEQIIECNPSNYTAWVRRREIIEELVRSGEYALEEELRWVKLQATENQKNYQVWHHLRHVVKLMKHDILGDGEILGLAGEEPKNTHFWGFFIESVLSHCEIKKAFEFTGEMIEEDVRNNSAYSARHTLLSYLVESVPGVLEEERRFLAKHAVLARNQAFWNYARALDRAHPELQVVQECEKRIKEREIPKYYED